MKLKTKQWAMITGASRGLGEEFARQLAMKGLNLVLVARSVDQLKHLAKELEDHHDVEVKIYSADLSDEASVSALIEHLINLKIPSIDLLINNAGLGYFSNFWVQSDQQLQEMMGVNINALVRLTHGILPSMIARRMGCILNIGSTAGFQPVPRFAIYAATKAFVLNFGEALSFECRGTGVQVKTFCPGPVATSFANAAHAPNKMFKNAAPAQLIASKALKAVESGCTLKWAKWTEALLSQAIRFVPRSWIIRVSAYIARD